jgi:hypothetical protein
MRQSRERHRDEPGANRQLDLFGPPGEPATGRTPAWEALPEQVRAELTALMTRLIQDHAHGASAIAGARHEPR